MKRCFDITVSLFLILALSPVVVIVALLISWKMGVPVLFFQNRPGLHGVTFNMAKFRTMNDSKDEKGHLLSDELRLTRFGRFLRSTSMDELPELWNVLKGDMSLVGPRPLLEEYIPLYNEEQMKRHDVKPGITGWAQINGRNAITWKVKFELDVWYVKNQSLLLDMKILFLTIKKVLIRDGISETEHATVQKFKGNVS